MNERSDSLAREMSAQPISVSQPHREQMVHVSGVAFDDRQDASGQLAAILDGELASTCGPRRQQWQTRAQYRGLQFVEPAVHTGVDVTIALALTAISQAPDPRGHGFVARDRGAAITEGSQVLGRVEAECGSVRARADRNVVLGGQVSLTAVLHDRERVSLG